MDNAVRGVSVSQLSSSPQKQWRVVSEHSAQNSGNEGPELNIGRGFSTMQMDGTVRVEDKVLQQRLENLARQRNEMQQVENELRALLIAKADIVGMQNNFNARLKEQAALVSTLQDQVRESEQTIHELERKMDDKEQELHTLRLENKAAWAKENLLREQNEELVKYRMEHENTEAERSHHKQQIQDLQEHVLVKEEQLLELQNQNRVAEETILQKDEQIRDAQAWITRVQKDGLQSSTLQAGLWGQTEQFNQLWLGWQGQFAEMERRHMQTIQQLQLELAGLGGHTGTHNSDSGISINASSDGSQIGRNSGNRVESQPGAPNSSPGALSNGNADNSQHYVGYGNSSSQANHATSPPITPSLLGIPSYFPHGQVPMHPYVMHQQGPHVPQSHIGHFHSNPAAAFQQWHNQQVISEGPTSSSQLQYSLPRAKENSSRSESNYGYEFPGNGTILHQDYLRNYMGQRVEPVSYIPSSETCQTLESVKRSYFADLEAQHNMQQISSQFHEALHLDPHTQTSEGKVHENDNGSYQGNESASQDLITEQPSSTASASPSESSIHPANASEASLNRVSDSGLLTDNTNTLLSGKVSEVTLLDERTLLACIVRTIPPGGKIRISSTLPSRLGKMLAPLHWHDYKTKYGKLDDFVASHPELFVIQGDQIQLREGAQGIIAATSAVAKLAAAAAASSPYVSYFPRVAVTPMGDTTRLRNAINSSQLHPSAVYTHYSNGNLQSKADAKQQGR